MRSPVSFGFIGQGFPTLFSLACTKLTLKMSAKPTCAMQLLKQSEIVLERTSILILQY